MKRVLWGVLLMLVCMFGHATTYYYSTNTAGNAPTMASVAPNSSGQGWCNAWYPIFSSAGHDNSGGYYGTSLSFSSGACHGLNGYLVTLQTEAACPSGQVDTGGVCVVPVCAAGSHEHLQTVIGGTIDGCSPGPSPCADGQTHLDDSCVIPACPAGQHHDSKSACVPDLVPCPNGGAALSLSSCSKLVCPAGDYIENNQCVKSTPPKPTNPANGCPAGTSNIGTASDGTAMCQGATPDTPLLDKTPPVTKTPTATATNQDGSTTTTDKSTATNSDGSTTTKTTTCNTPAGGGGATCQTGTATGNNTAGTPGKSDGGLGGTGDGSSGSGSGACSGSDCTAKTMCDKNPMLNVCQNSQVTNGGCSGGRSTVAVQGDAIQGAILRKIADDDCANLVPNASVTLGNNLLAGTDPQQSAINAAMTGTTTDMSGQSLDQSGFLGGGSCLSNRSITLAGHAIPVSFSSVCSNITPIRYIVLACSLIAACMLVSKSVLQG